LFFEAVPQKNNQKLNLILVCKRILKEKNILQNLTESPLEIKNKESKLCFIGVALGESGSTETGISVIDRKSVYSG